MTYTPNQTYMRLERHVALIRQKRNMYRIQVEKSEVKRPLGRPKDRREGNISMDIKEGEWKDCGQDSGN